jgi:hypothetical protein
MSTHFLHSTNTGITVCFSPADDGTVSLSYQRTRDPNEDSEEDIYSAEVARFHWKRLINEGYVTTNGWHQCKRVGAWDNNYYAGDE